MGVKHVVVVQVLCLDAETGTEIWQHSIDEPQQPYSTPTLDGNSVYALSNKGIMMCLNVNSSGLCLKKKTEDLVWASEPHINIAHRDYYGTPVIYGSNGKQGLLLATCIGITSAELESGNKL